MLASQPSPPPRESDVPANGPAGHGPESPLQGFLHSPWRPVAAVGGLLVVLAAGLPFLLKPKTEAATEPEPTGAALTAADIATVQPLVQKPARTVAGRLLLASQSAGVSSVDGTVARVLVQPGSRVKRGQVVAEISIGTDVRTPAAIEKKQTKAEAAQEKAVDQQSEMGRKIARARVRLAEAQVRVDAAQARVAEMRQIVKRLQAGERIPVDASSGSAAPLTGTPADEPAPATSTAKVRSRASREALLRGQRDLQAAQKAADDANRKLSSAEAAAARATTQLKAAETKVEKVEEQFERQLVSAAEVEDARSTAREAQQAATETVDRAFAARQESSKAQARVEMLKNNLEGLEGGENTAPEPIRPRKDKEPAPDTGAVEYLTLGGASKMAREALEESAAASRAAEEIHREIEASERQVHASSSGVVAATEQLAAAQQEVMDAVPRPQFVEVVAPVDGIVSWTLPLAREVKKGQKVFGMAQNETLACGFKVSPEVAASMPRGTGMPGVLTGRAYVATTGGMPSLPPTTPGKLLPVVTATVQTVSPPEPNGMVDISGPLSIVTLGDPPIQPKPGLEVIVSFRPLDPTEQVSLPAGSVTRSAGKSWVATVLEGSAPGSKSLLVWKSVIVAGQSSQRVLLRGLPPGTRYFSNANTALTVSQPGAKGTPFIVPSPGPTAGTPGPAETSVGLNAP